MSKYRKLILIVRDAREQLNDECITKEEANVILKNVWSEYQLLAADDKTASLEDLIKGLFNQEQKTDFNFLA